MSRCYIYPPTCLFRSHVWETSGKICVTTTNFWLATSMLKVHPTLPCCSASKNSWRWLMPHLRHWAQLWNCSTVYVCHFMGRYCFSYALLFFLTELLYMVWGRQLDIREGKLLNLFEVVHYTCVCFSCKSLLSCSTLKAAPEHLRSYGDRLRLCKVLSGFRVRTITINRAIAYMSSGEHMQWLLTKIFIAMKFSITVMRETVFINNHQFMTDA